MSKKLKILLAEGRSLSEPLYRDDFESMGLRRSSRADGKACDPLGVCIVALLDFKTPGMDGAKAGVELLKDSPETRVVLTVESVPSEVLNDLRARGTTSGRS